MLSICLSRLDELNSSKRLYDGILRVYICTRIYNEWHGSSCDFDVGLCCLFDTILLCCVVLCCCVVCQIFYLFVHHPCIVHIYSCSVYWPIPALSLTSLSSRTTEYHHRVITVVLPTNKQYHPIHTPEYSCTLAIQSSKMCYKVVERFSVCKCLYYEHAVDPCERYGQYGHSAEEKTVLVGYACEKHSYRR